MRKDWEYKKLGEVANVVMGQSPDGSNVNNENGMEFHQGKINFGEQFLMKSDCFTTQVTKVAEKGSILLCVRAPIGIINITDRDICIGRGLCAIKEKTEVDNLFLYYYLLNKKLYFEKNSTGSTFKAISSKVVLHTPIFLPPKPTQLAIVAELDKLNEMIRLKKQQLEDYDQLAQSIFYEMFGDPVENEKGWEVKKYGDLFTIGSGGTPSKAKEEYWNNGDIPWIGSNMCQNRIIYKTDGKYITKEGLNNSSAKLLMPGTILVALVGATIGKVALLKTETTTNQNIAFIKVNETKEFMPEYVYYFLMNQYNEFLNIGNGNFKMANLSFIKGLFITKAPLPLQQQFAARIEAIERQKQQVSETIKDLETLLASRMQYWFD